jgi:hypothetical protein
MFCGRPAKAKRNLVRPVLRLAAAAARAHSARRPLPHYVLRTVYLVLDHQRHLAAPKTACAKNSASCRPRPKMQTLAHHTLPVHPSQKPPEFLRTYPPCFISAHRRQKLGGEKINFAFCTAQKTRAKRNKSAPSAHDPFTQAQRSNRLTPITTRRQLPINSPKCK